MKKIKLVLTIIFKPFWKFVIIAPLEIIGVIEKIYSDDIINRVGWDIWIIGGLVIWMISVAINAVELYSKKNDGIKKNIGVKKVEGGQVVQARHIENLELYQLLGEQAKEEREESLENEVEDDEYEANIEIKAAKRYRESYASLRVINRSNRLLDVRILVSSIYYDRQKRFLYIKDISEDFGLEKHTLSWHEESKEDGWKQIIPGNDNYRIANIALENSDGIVFTFYKGNMEPLKVKKCRFYLVLVPQIKEGDKVITLKKKKYMVKRKFEDMFYIKEVYENEEEEIDMEGLEIREYDFDIKSIRIQRVRE